MSTRVIKQCGCGRRHTQAAWDALPDSHVYAVDSVVFEQRLCSCGSHIIVVLAGDPDDEGRAMTYEESEKWLRAIGGERILGRETERFSSVIVTLKSAINGEMSRHALYDATLHGEELEAAIRDAFIKACLELRVALSSP